MVKVSDETTSQEKKREKELRLVRITQELMGPSFRVHNTISTGLSVFHKVSDRRKIGHTFGHPSLTVYDPNYFNISFDLAELYEAEIGEKVELIKDYSKYGSREE